MYLPTLETERLQIRRFVPDDGQAAAAYMTDPGVMAFIPGGALTPEQVRSTVERSSGDAAEEFAVILKSEQQLIGSLVFHPWFAPRTHEIGWLFHRSYHGRGYASEAALAVARHAFETLGCHRLIATCQPENPASYRVMEKLGMRREGWFRKCIALNSDGSGQWWDELFYALLETEWFARARAPRDL